MPKKRIGELDLLRFLFSILIVLLHFDTGFFPYGSIGVEFFFTLSGLLMARHAEKWVRTQPEQGRDLGCIADETWTFMKGKGGSFFKYYVFAFLFNVVIRNIIVKKAAAGSVVLALLKSIPTITLTFFPFFENSTSFYVPVTWYLSVMLIAMFILYPILLRNYRFAVKIVFPIITVFVLAYLYNTNAKNNITTIDIWTGLTYTAVLRAVSEIAFGATLYYISTEITGNEAFMRRAERPFLRLLLTLAKAVCFVIVLMHARKYVFGLTFNWSFQLHALFFCGIGILLSFSGLGWIIPDCKLTRYLGRISLPIYIFHRLLRYTWLSILGTEEVSLKYNLFMAAVCVLASIVLMYFTDVLDRGIKKLRAAWKKDLSTGTQA